MKHALTATLVTVALVGCAATPGAPGASGGRYMHTRIAGLEGVAFQLDATTPELCAHNAANWPRSPATSISCSDIDAAASLPASVVINGAGWERSLEARFQTMPMCEFARSEWQRRGVGVNAACMERK